MINLLILLFLIACIEDNKVLEHSDIPDCVKYENSPEFNVKKCEESIVNPKFKRGERLIVTNGHYHSSCEFTNYNRLFSHYRNQNIYFGTVTCEGEYVDQTARFMEDDLERYDQ